MLAVNLTGMLRLRADVSHVRSKGEDGEEMFKIGILGNYHLGDCIAFRCNADCWDYIQSGKFT